MRENVFYKQIIDSSPIGYAYHKILCGENGVPYDYKYIETNQSFEELTGLNQNYIIGKTITKVLPGILECEFDWIACYGEVALTGAEKTFEQYSEPLKKWYRVNAFSPEKGYFVTTFVDITNERKQIEDLSKVLQTSDYYLSHQDKIDYQKITDTIMELSESKVASFNIYDEDGDTYRTVAISADSNLIRKGTEVLGMNLEGEVWKHDLLRAEKIENQVITRFNNLSDLTGDVIPSTLVDILVKSFGLGETVLVKITKENRMIGDFTLIMEKGKAFDKDEICEVYAKQLGLAIEIKRTERNLLSSRQEYMSLVENAPGVVYRCLNNHNWTMLMMSNEIERITGYHPDRFIRDQEKNYASIIHPEDIKNVLNEIQKAITADKPWSIDYRIVHKDGSIRWIHEKGRAIKNEEGLVTYLDGVILDITERKRLEEEEIKHKKLTYKSFDVISILSSDGTILYESESTKIAFGYPAGDRVGKNGFNFVHEDDKEIVSKAFIELIANPDKEKKIEFRFLHNDGSWVWLETIGQNLIADSDVKGIVVNSRDITDRKRLEQEFIKKQEELETYFTSSLDMLCIANTKGKFIRLNPEWEKVLGYSIKELEGSVFLDYVHPDDLESTLHAIKDLESQQEVTSFTNRYRCNNGTYRWIEWRSKLINQMIYAVARDITEHIELQKSLSDREKQYRILAENVADVVWTTDLKLNTTWVSPSVYQLTGETPEQHMASNIQDRFNQNGLIKLNNLLHQQLLLEDDPKADKKRSVEIELQHRKKDGNSVWVSMKMIFLRDEDGRPIGIHGVTRDISERVEKEYAIKRKNNQQKILLSASEKLINAVSEDLNSVIEDALSQVAKISVADRVYLFEYDYDSQVTNNIYEWCDEGILPQIDQLQNVSFSEIEEWLYYHQKGESIVINDVQSLSEGDSIREILELQGIKSLLLVPIFFEGELFGFIGFDSVRQHHFYTQEEQSVLYQFANNLVMTIKKERYTSSLKRTKEKLRSANKLLDSMFNSIQDGISVLNADLTIREANQKMSELYGNANVLVGRYCYEVYQNRKTACENCPTLKSLETKKACSDIVPLIVDGQQKGWLEIFTYPMIDSSTGNIEGVVEIVRDVTERKRIKDDLLIKAHVLDQIQDTVTVTDLDGNIIYVNAAESKTLGYTAGELIGLSTEIFGEDEEHGATQKEIIEKTLLNGMWRGEVVNKTVDGKEVIYDTRTQIITDGEGSKIALAGVSTDITQRKIIDKQLADERERFKTTLLSVGDGIISTDKEGKVLILNPIAEQLTGWTQEEALGKPIEEVFNIVNEFTRQRCENPVQKVLETGEINELGSHTMLIKKGGSAFTIEDSAAPIKDENGNINGVVLVFRDFADKKAKQEKIRYLSNHDQLTGLYNRHYFEEQLNSLDIEDNLPFTIVMADVNGLKLTNDAFGHKAGDDLLTTVANILKKECRSSDIVARVGGDEFVILLPKTTSCETEKIINCFYSAIFKENHDSVIISVSFGWETKQTYDQNIHKVLSRAEEHMYRQKLVESQSMRNQTIRVIMQTLNETNNRERVHSERVRQISRTIGEAMQLDSDTLKELETAALMHDIGKIAIAESILNKAGKLTASEYESIQRHCEIGYHILKSVDAYTNLAEYVLSHHERWDGTGYPRGLSGECIPLIARIIAVADSFEAMIGDRPYRNSLSQVEALEEIIRCSGAQFDPDIVNVFCAMQLNK